MSIQIVFETISKRFDTDLLKNYSGAGFLKTRFMELFSKWDKMAEKGKVWSDSTLVVIVGPYL